MKVSEIKELSNEQLLVELFYMEGNDENDR